MGQRLGVAAEFHEGDEMTAGHDGQSSAEVEDAPVAVPRHFAGFDGLRAIAAVSVLLVHTAFLSGFTFKSPLGIYTSRLDIGVSIFFLISGFLLYRPFAVSHVTGKGPPSTRRFWVRRVLRIVPAYWLALTLLTFVFHLTSVGPGIGNVLAHYFLLQIYFPTAVTTGIGQAWTLCTEMSFYLVLPWLAAAIGSRLGDARRQLRREVVAVVAMYLVSASYRWWWSNESGMRLVSGHLQPFCYPNCGNHGRYVWLMDLWLPAWIDLFALGMLLAVLSAWWTEHDTEPRWLASRWMPWLSWAAAGIAFWSASHIGAPISPAFVPGPVIGMEMHALYGAFAFFLLLPAVFGPDDRSLIRRFLRCWPMASLGAVSYGIYLWHQGVAQKVLSASGHALFQVSFWYIAIGTLIATTVVASISYFGLERPVLRIKGHLAWWNRSSDPLATDDVEVLSK